VTRLEPDPFDAVAAALARFPKARFDDGYYGICFDEPIPFRRLDDATFLAEYDARFRALPAVPVFARSIDLAACVRAGTHVETRTVLYSIDPQSPWEEATQAAAIVAGDALDLRALRAACWYSTLQVFMFHPDQPIALALTNEPILFGLS
jgi:hypothetical protein